MEILLADGQKVMIDDEDYRIVCGYAWHAVRDKNTYYARTTIRLDRKPKALSMHRLIMGLNFGDKRQVDHVNGNGLDNTRKNLRVVTSRQNNMNRRVRRNTTSNYKGVSWDQRTKKWRVTITINQRSRDIGFFSDEVLAAKTYDRKARELFGEYACLNFPDC